MSSPPKKPRRTAERILDIALGLLNRFGEPNVSTTLIATELGISPGNLYYHYPSKDVLINALVTRFEQAAAVRLAQAGEVADLDDAARFFEGLFDCAWQYRFLYRDLNDLMSKNRALETAVVRLLDAQHGALARLVDRLRAAQVLRLGASEAPPVVDGLLLMLTHALNHAAVRDPRHALEPEAAARSVGASVYHALCLLQPYVPDGDARRRLQARAPTAEPVAAPGA